MIHKFLKLFKLKFDFIFFFLFLTHRSRFLISESVLTPVFNEDKIFP